MFFDDPASLRQEIRAGRFADTTAGQVPGFAQANLVVLPASLAPDFLDFCHRNPKPCPILEVLDEGDPLPRLTAVDADIRTDVPSYRLFISGHLEFECADMTRYWREDATAFLLGCSFTFEEALTKAGITVRHQKLKRTVPMYRTNIPCHSAGPFRGHMVVSMRPIPEEKVTAAVEITQSFTSAHGAPVHVGNPSTIGIRELSAPDYGDAVPIRKAEVPVFWACGVTPQAIALQSSPEWMITHSPGRMFVTDVRNDQLNELR